MIDAREPEILVRPGTKRLGKLLTRVGRIDVSARDLFEQILQLLV